MTEQSTSSREDQIKRGRRLEYFTIIYNCMEGLISIVAGLIAGSVSLVGFGIDSAIEVTSGSALLWRLNSDRDAEQRETAERRTLQIVGVCFIALAIYILYDSGSILIRRKAPERSIPGILVAAVSAMVMPWLAKAKRQIASTIGSAAMRADSRQTDFCAYLSAILLGGLLLNALFGWWWADPLSAVLMVPIIVKEGLGSLKGKECSYGCNH
jgi:divalent metal cation (Fe/Co/Zn/Cd) transporter